MRVGYHSLNLIFINLLLLACSATFADSGHKQTRTDVIEQETQRVSAELDAKPEANAKPLRRKVIDDTTIAQEPKYAAYLRAWSQKIERIGALVYPDEAKRQKLNGTLVLRVSVWPDGTMREIALLRSSGYKILDEAAIRAVHMAAPFAPFPKDIAGEIDILDIVRTWRFLGDIQSFSNN
jgi:protein TonB